MERSDRTENFQLHIQTTELSETAPRRRNRTPLRFLIVLPLMLAMPALAQVRVPVSNPVIASSPASDPRAALFESGQRRYLLGDWGGKRAWLAEKGVTFDFFYTSDMQANPSGGMQQTQAGWERVRGTIDINFDRLITWQGLSFHATGLCVAPTDSTVLVLGETGTGKELIARAIHNLSARCGRPFIKLNCAAIPFDLLESELFGHEKGAFTGAIAQTIGRFEMAHSGTLFLDEIGDLPLALQPKLLRVLQEQEFERLGSGRTHRIDVRLVAATHRDLNEMVARNEFRSDLYYRLNVFPILLPPLRERPRDIPVLVTHFVKTFSQRMGKPIRQIPPETLEAFTLYSWPGNVRESDRASGHQVQ
jgi:hypothetical protein